MADNIAPAPAAPPSAAPQPSSQVAPADTGKGYSVEPDIASAARDALGDFGMTQPAPVLDEPTTEGAQPPPLPGVPQGTQPAPDGSTPVVEGDKTQQPPALPGEDYLKSLETEGLLAPDQKPPALQEPSLPTSPEDIAKAINPSGKETVETQLKNAQSFIGKQGQKFGETIKAQQKLIGELTQGATEFVKRFKQDPNAPGGLRATAETVLEFYDTVPEPEMVQAIAKRGWKLVPANAEMATGEDPVERAWMEKYVNTAVPGEMTYEEKLASIESDSKLNRRLTTDLATWKGNRQAQVDAYNRQQGQQLQQERQKNEETVGTFWQNVSKHPDYAALKGAMLKWHNLFGPWEGKDGRPLPGSMPVTVRLKAMRMLAEVERFPTILRKAVKDAYDAGIAKASGVSSSMAPIPGSGEAPDISANAGSQPGAGKNAAVVTDADRASFGLKYVR